jgi:hypothetical protein
MAKRSHSRPEASGEDHRPQGLSPI